MPHIDNGYSSSRNFEQDVSQGTFGGISALSRESAEDLRTVS